MKIKEFIEALKQFDEDYEINITDGDGEFKSKIFKLIQCDEDKRVGLVVTPDTITQCNAEIDCGDKIWINPYDNFYMWDDDGNVMKYNKSKYNKTRIEILYKNTNTDYEIYRREKIKFESRDTLSVGGLIRLLNNFEKGMPVNLMVNGECFRIKDLQKRDCEYLCGSYDDVSSYSVAELFLTGAYQTDNMDDKWLIDMEDVETWKIGYEFDDLVHDTCLKHEKDFNLKEFIQDLHNAVFRLYKVKRRLRASHDSNGIYHLFDDDKLYYEYNKGELEKVLEPYFY